MVGKAPVSSVMESYVWLVHQPISFAMDNNGW